MFTTRLSLLLDQHLWEDKQKIINSVGVIIKYEDIKKDCPICLESHNEILMTSCLHIFCVNCIERWFINRRQKRCPLCRCQLF